MGLQRWLHSEWLNEGEICLGYVKRSRPVWLAGRMPINLRNTISMNLPVKHTKTHRLLDLRHRNYRYGVWDWR